MSLDTLVKGKSLKLARRATYRDASGFETAAIVIGTNESVKDGTDVQRPEPGNANLLIFKPKTGETYVRFNVKQGDGPRTFSI